MVDPTHIFTYPNLKDCRFLITVKKGNREEHAEWN